MNALPARPHDPGPVVVGVIPHQPPEVLMRSVMFAQALGTRLICAWADASSYLGPPDPTGERRFLPVDPESYVSTQGFTTQVENLIHDVLDAQQVEWTFEVLAGDAVRNLAELAERSQASMIVVGTREPGLTARLDEMLTGSVAEHLANHQPCPVLVVPLHPKPYG